MDRGMVSAANIEFLKEGNRRYIVGTLKTMLRKYEKQLIASIGTQCMKGLKSQTVQADPDGGERPSSSAARPSRREKEKAMHKPFREPHRGGD